MAKQTPRAQADYAEALNRIEACRKQGLQGDTLNLSELGLVRLPPEISELTALRKLDLSGNNLTSLRPIEALPELTTLNLRENHLTQMPPELGKLTTLKMLNLS